MEDFILNYFDDMKNIQKTIIDYLDDESDQNISNQDLLTNLDNLNIRSNQYILKGILHLISKIIDNHHRSPHFFDKIELIISSYQNEMKKFLSNFEIFNIFKSNTRILLYLFEHGIIILDKTIYYIFMSSSYLLSAHFSYFSPEIKSFRNDKTKQMDENEFKTFEEKRIIGENDNYICHLIRNDLIDDFIVYLNKTNFPISSNIQSSIFETNSFLVNHNNSNNKVTTLIKYAAFFGSIQIFNYLRFNNAEMDSLLWLYAIHGNNPEIIHILEENGIKIHKDAYIESMKCHHLDIMDYIKTNFFENEIENDFNLFLLNLKYYNFFELENQKQFLTFSNNDDHNFIIFYNCCKYDYFNMVEFMLNNNIINESMINKLDSICTII